MVSFENYYVIVVSFVIFIVALLIGLIMNDRYYRVIKELLKQVGEVESKGSLSVSSGEVEVLMCPRCGYSKTIPYRLGDYVGKVVDETCPNDGEKLVVHAIYISRSSGQYS